MLRDILESIVRWYFKRYHPEKDTTIIMEYHMYEPGDVLTDSESQSYLYLGKEQYFKV